MYKNWFYCVVDLLKPAVFVWVILRITYSMKPRRRWVYREVSRSDWVSKRRYPASPTYWSRRCLSECYQFIETKFMRVAMIAHWMGFQSLQLGSVSYIFFVFFFTRYPNTTKSSRLVCGTLNSWNWNLPALSPLLLKYQLNTFRSRDVEGVQPQSSCLKFRSHSWYSKYFASIA